MRAAEGMHIEWVDQEAVVLDQSSGRIHYLNPQAAVVYALVLEHGYDSAMVELRSRFGNRPELDEQVSELVQEMVQAGLLVDD
jgi:hypothetical protein